MDNLNLLLTPSKEKVDKDEEKEEEVIIDYNKRERQYKAILACKFGQEISWLNFKNVLQNEQDSYEKASGTQDIYNLKETEGLSDNDYEIKRPNVAPSDQGSGEA
ncbi:14001_t:CDS:2 [Cetraspora pellucida]|uniref:14001_t:CDS:1 n=1 Tax=Cetraspora pellucida TaxID=1433469 RepID=A0A9N9GV48_9GLOM|nr:14001_t:CDS:2 [Cetraspora pellucida]